MPVSRYPHFGHPLVPILLEHAFWSASKKCSNDEKRLLTSARNDLSSSVWDRLPEEACLALAAIVRRILGFLPLTEQVLEYCPFTDVRPGLVLSDLELSNRTFNCLANAGWRFRPLYECDFTVDIICHLRGFGRTCLLELLCALDYSTTQDIFIEGYRISHTDKPSPTSDLLLRYASSQNADLDCSRKVIASVIYENLCHICDENSDSVAVVLAKLSKSPDACMFLSYYHNAFNSILRLLEILSCELSGLTQRYPLSSLDPRLGGKVKAVLGECSDLSQALKARTYYLSSVVRAESLRCRLSTLLDVLQVCDRYPIEYELRELVPADERNANIFSHRHGWDGDGVKTLEETGRAFGLTKERVRQICNKVITRKPMIPPYAPVLDKTLAHLEAMAGLSTEAIEATLIEAGLSRQNFRLSGLFEAAIYLGREIPSIVPSRAYTKSITHIAAQLVRQYGVVTLRSVYEDATYRSIPVASVDVIYNILKSHNHFQLLDQKEGWFWFGPERNRVANSVCKILAVSPSLSLAELREGVSRPHRMQGLCPPSRALASICANLPGVHVDCGTVVAEDSGMFRDILRGMERLLVDVMLELDSVVRREELEALCRDVGISRESFYSLLSYSPVIVVFARGIYGLRGRSVSPGTIEALPQRKRQCRVVKESGYTAEGKIYIKYRLSEAMVRNGTIIVPRALREMVVGEFSLELSSGRSIGALKINPAGSWGLRPFFTRMGGEPGDTLVVEFDIVARTARARIDQNFDPDLRT